MVISKNDVDSFFQSDFIPYITSFYNLSVKATIGIEDVLRLILQAIQKLSTDEAKVLKKISLRFK